MVKKSRRRYLRFNALHACILGMLKSILLWDISIMSLIFICAGSKGNTMDSGNRMTETIHGLKMNVSIVIMVSIFKVHGNMVNVPIGLIVDRESTGVLQTFSDVVKWYNLKTQNDATFGSFRLYPKVTVLDVTDSFTVSNAICNHLDNGVVAFLGIYRTSALSTIQSYSDTFQVPFLTLSAAPNSSSTRGYQIYMRPITTTAVVDVMLEFGWKQVVYIYNSDEGLIRLQELFNTLQATDKPVEIDVKRIVDEKGCLATMRELGKVTNSYINVLLDVAYKDALSIVYQIVEDANIDSEKFRILIADVAATTDDLMDLSHKRMNVTAFQLLPSSLFEKWKYQFSAVNASHHLSTMQCDEALTVDSVTILAEAISTLLAGITNMHEIKQQYKYKTRKSLKCAEKDIPISPYGGIMMEKLKKTKLHGLTGQVAFDQHGHRDGFSLDIVQTCPKHFIQKVGMWTPNSHLLLYSTIDDFDTTKANKSKVVTVVTATI